MQDLDVKKALVNENQNSTLDSHSLTLKQIFHLSLSALNLEHIRNFYELNFACQVRRITKSGKGLHINFFGHQLTFVEVTPEKHWKIGDQNEHGSPLVHFGVALPYYVWSNLKERLERNQVDFCVKPHLKFKGENHEHYVMFVKDPSGNAIEIKSFTKTNDWL